MPASYPEVVSLYENFHAKEGGKGNVGEAALRLSFFSFPKSPALHHQSFACHSRLAFALASVRKKKSLRRRQHLVLYVGKSYIDLFLRNSREKH